MKLYRERPTKDFLWTLVLHYNNKKKKKKKKYADLDGRYIFEPIAIVLNTSARQLLCDLDRKISEHTGEVRETSFLFQRWSVLVQRFNATLLHDSLPAFDCTGWLVVSILYYL